MNITDKIDALLADQTDDGLVNFNSICKLTVITNNPIGRLLSRGGLEDIKTNLINLANGNETRVVHKKASIHYVDPRLAIAFIKKHCPDLSDEVADWELEYGRGDIPEKLGDEAPELLRHLMSVFDNSKFRCTFQDGEWFFCLHDVIQAATGDQPGNSRNVDRAYELDNSLVVTKSYKFYRSSEMQIVNIDTAARFWMVLPGKKASIFRKNLADLFIRVLGGDAKLAEEIKVIGEFEDRLPTDHPLSRLHVKNAEIIQPPVDNAIISILELQREQLNMQRQQMERQFELFRQQIEQDRAEYQRQMEIERERSSREAHERHLQILDLLKPRNSPRPHHPQLVVDRPATINDVRDFLNLNTTLSETGHIMADVLFARFKQYATANGLQRPAKRNSFTLLIKPLKAEFHMTYCRNIGQNSCAYRGRDIKPHMQLESYF